MGWVATAVSDGRMGHGSEDVGEFRLAADFGPFSCLSGEYAHAVELAGARTVSRETVRDAVTARAGTPKSGCEPSPSIFSFGA